MVILKFVRRVLQRHFTIMLIPHNSVSPRQIRVPFSLLLFLPFVALCVLSWTGYLSSLHLDYLKLKTDQKLVQMKARALAQEIKRSQAMLEQVQKNDAKLRSLLNLRSREAILEDNSDGKGGPSAEDTQALEKLLAGELEQVTQEEIARQTEALKAEAERRLASYRDLVDQIDTQRIQYRATPNGWPCWGGHVSSTYGHRIHPIYGGRDFHSGLDIAGAKNTPVLATADGVVRLSSRASGYGLLVILNHRYGYCTYYGHLCRIMVKEGQRVRRGQIIGLMGNTGTSTGTHLHYEVRHHGNPVNPTRFLKKENARL